MGDRYGKPLASTSGTGGGHPDAPPADTDAAVCHSAAESFTIAMSVR